MHWYPLTTKEALLLLVVFLISGIFSHLQQYFVAPSERPFTYVLVLFLLMLAFYPAAKPADPLQLAKFLAVVIGTIFAAMIVLKDLVIRQNLSWNIAVLLAGAVLCPLVAGWCYHQVAKRPGH